MTTPTSLTSPTDTRASSRERKPWRPGDPLPPSDKVKKPSDLPDADDLDEIVDLAHYILICREKSEGNLDHQWLLSQVGFVIAFAGSAWLYYMGPGFLDEWGGKMTSILVLVVVICAFVAMRFISNGELSRREWAARGTEFQRRSAQVALIHEVDVSLRQVDDSVRELSHAVRDLPSPLGHQRLKGTLGSAQKRRIGLM